MCKYLITGFSGFVSRHFLELLNTLSVKFEVLGIDILLPSFNFSGYKNLSVSFNKVDLLDFDYLRTTIANFKPVYILHLASYSSVGYSWKNPVLSFSHNTNIFLNLVESVRLENIKCRILSIGSSEEYGNVSSEMMPLTEDYQLNPVSPYAVARVSQELLSKVYVEGYGLDIVLTRSFNHIGPYQLDIFVISSFAKQLVNISKSSKFGIIQAGDVSIIRDFVDVRDVVKAYYLLLLNGKSGEIYNVCKGEGNKLFELINIMSEILKIEIKIEINKKLIRPNDNMIIIGSNAKILKQIKWIPEISLNQTLIDMINWWKEQ